MMADLCHDAGFCAMYCLSSCAVLGSQVSCLSLCRFTGGCTICKQPLLPAVLLMPACQQLPCVCIDLYVVCGGRLCSAFLCSRLSGVCRSLCCNALSRTYKQTDLLYITTTHMVMRGTRVLLLSVDIAEGHTLLNHTGKGHITQHLVTLLRRPCFQFRHLHSVLAPLVCPSALASVTCFQLLSVVLRCGVCSMAAVCRGADMVGRQTCCTMIGVP